MYLSMYLCTCVCVCVCDHQSISFGIGLEQWNSKQASRPNMSRAIYDTCTRAQHGTWHTEYTQLVKQIYLQINTDIFGKLPETLVLEGWFSLTAILVSTH